MPEEAGLRQAAEVLNAGKKMAMLIGAGALGCEDEVIAVADRLGAGCRQGAARQVCAPGRPALGHRPDRPARHQAELGPHAGVRHPVHDRIQLSVDRVPAQAEGNCPRCADRPQGRAPQPALPDGGQPRRPYRADAEGAAAAAASRTATSRSWRKTIASNLDEWWKVVESRAMASADPVNPQRIFTELNKQLPDDVIMTADSGSVADWYARDIRVRRGMMGSLSGGLASLGAATPYADGGQDGLSGAAGHRFHRRRRVPDERHERDDHRVQILEAGGPTRASSSWC